MRYPTLVFTLLLGAAAGADVSFVEEITNSGVGPKKVGARKQTNQVFIKGERQRVHSEIQTSKETAQALQKQGQSLNGSTVLRLDRANVYQIDHAKQVFVQSALPAPAPGAAAGSAAKPAAKDPAGPEVAVQVKDFPDTSRIEGILCRRVAVEMRARYYEPGTQKLRRENRYLYQAWISKDFPAYQEIRQFETLQNRKTSYPPLVRGGLEQLKDAVDDYGPLAGQLAALEGLPMESVLKVFVNTGGNEQQVFQLNRRIKAFSYSAVPDSVFEVSKNLQRVK
jgi:hypothetical protein